MLHPENSRAEKPLQSLRVILSSRPAFQILPPRRRSVFSIKARAAPQ
jgi:hypothetical protein